MTNEIDLGIWLQGRRAELGLTQSDIAKRVGVSQATISLWENNRAQPDEVQIESLQAAFTGMPPVLPAAENKDAEGLDSSSAAGWGGQYPLDAVFVRTDQRTVGEVVRRIRSDRYDLNPEFQRDFLWPIDKQSRLIESCLMRIPLPVLYVAEAQDGKIIVVDGLQRLSTFRRYLDNNFKLTFSKSEEGKSHPLEGKKFNDLDLQLQERIEDTQLTLYILDSKAPERAKLDIFERVNSGEPLTRQQMRNCLYNGAATRWLKEATKSEVFQLATGSSLDSNKMRDREAINRFCAFSILGWKHYSSGEMDSFLAEALDRMNKMSVQQTADLRTQFDRTMRINFSLFAQHAFRKSLVGTPTGDRSVLNIALFDVCSVILARADEAKIERHADAVKAAIRGLIQDGEFNHAITYSTNSRKQVEKRFGEMEDKLSEVLS
jgi:transcriptional regulator with XRE-family HTH domain